MRANDVRVLIIIPRTVSVGREYYTYVAPVGLAYISSVLKQSGHAVTFLNLNHSDGPVNDLIREALSREEYKVILTGGLSVHYTAVKSCVDSARRYAPAARIVLGGGLVSSLPELMFNALQPDCIVIGEGELTIVELLQYFENNRDLFEVDGIGYRGPDGKVVLTKPRKPIKDIDSLPWPDYEGLGFADYLDKILSSTLYYYDVFDNPRPYPIIASRSCPFQCTFCFHPIGNQYRQRSIPNIIDEVAYAIERHRINIIDIFDELFSHDRERVFNFCKQLKKLLKTVPWEVKWNAQMRVDCIDEELVETMKDAGCYLLSLGLESYSPVVLESMRKKITPQQIDAALRICHDLNMTIQGNFIFGDVAETVGTAYETLNYWEKNRDLLGAAISLGFIQVYPGTALYKHCLKRGIIANEIDFIENHLLEPINMTTHMTDQEFEQLRMNIADAMFKYSIVVTPRLARRTKGAYETHVKCPYCNVVSVYKNYVPPGRDSYQRQDICCRNCRMRFHVISSRSLKLKIWVRRMIGDKMWHLLFPVWRGMKMSMSYISHCIGAKFLHENKEL